MCPTLDLLFLCAGRGSRVGLEVPKQFAELRGKPVMIYSLEVYERIPQIGHKIIIHAAGESNRIQAILDRYKITNYLLVQGGETRQESVRRGLAHVSTPRVVTHNAAVAFVSVQTVMQAIATMADCVTTSSKVKDNMVAVGNGSLRHVSRHGMYVINSPQTFRTSVFRAAHACAEKEGLKFSTDAELMLHYEHEVRLVSGPAWSFKITERADLVLAETMLTRPDLFPCLLQ